jgi:hypothetical protein
MLAINRPLLGTAVLWDSISPPFILPYRQDAGAPSKGTSDCSFTGNSAPKRIQLSSIMVLESQFHLVHKRIFILYAKTLYGAVQTAAADCFKHKIL